jgi:hypothetical protein
MRCNPDHVKEDEMGGTRNMHGDKRRNAYRVWVVKPEKIDHQEDTDGGGGGGIILQEVIGRTIRLLSFDTTRIILKKKKKMTKIHRHKDSNAIS